MKRAWLAWVFFSLCAVALLLAMAWVSRTAIRLDEAQTRARHEAAREENVRLSLWRMESALSSIILQETSRPYFAYQPFYAAGRAYTRMYGNLKTGEIPVPSPLLYEISPYFRLHFQYDPMGEIASPQIPEGPMKKAALERYTTTDRIRESVKEIGSLRELVTLDDLRNAIPKNWLQVERSEAGETAFASARRTIDRTKGSSPASSLQKKAQVKTQVSGDKNKKTATARGKERVDELRQAGTQNPNPKAASSPGPPQSGATAQSTESQGEVSSKHGKDLSPSQQIRNYQEWTARENMANINQAVVLPSAQKEIKISPPRKRVHGLKPVEIRIGAFTPLWVKNELILARYVSINGDDYIQGCWLNWPHIHEWLLTGVRDLLPEADLAPELSPPDPAEGRTLASLPLRLIPGSLVSGPAEEASPLMFSIKVAWLCILIAVFSVGILLQGAISLSQRRAAFVSSVTHELRTPLTTFSMYTEMLVDGMATDPAKLAQYHQTLHREAGRLSHLVENVLAYARLERGRYGTHEIITLGELVERLSGCLTAHAKRAGMELVITFPEAEQCKAVKTDLSAIERIIFNLVDNACKYARSAEDRRIHFDVSTGEKWAHLSVRDHGPGIGRRKLKRIFSPFRKSAIDAAKSAPGVGIGLPLSRRLARAVGGRLRVLDSSDGVCLCLDIPVIDREAINEHVEPGNES